ncbi:AAA family ATPase [Aliiroseovarius lamellibrachiae]|uniref:AAA family ATPase n=1 Tax=Aliiroseovarius lamellibrachiae TaxID=1924933 RepID=UPI001BE11815|nr:ATP-binding protein [Aliiroseovarius lamellibrachiae]MBT2131199.1 ATP-binding protein [Aliiroseovarius lamellibrachiae]
MSETPQLYNSLAPLRNVTALVSLIERVNNRAIGLPGLATFYGHSGFGKTTAAIYSANKFNAVSVQIKECWTGKKMGQAILAELGIKPQKTISDMVDQIAHELLLSDRVLLIDDAQYLIKRGMIGLIKDIYESCGTTIILIGEEELPQSLQRWENIHGRMLDWVAAQPACVADVDHLAKIYCPNVDLTAEFKAHLLKASVHSIRRVCVNLGKVAEFAITKGTEEVSLEDWGNRAFFASAAPAPRRELA